MLQISNAEYRKSDGISSTELKKIAISPMHYRFWKDNPQEDTPAMSSMMKSFVKNVTIKNSKNGQMI